VTKVRQELSDIRQELHFNEFQAVLKSSSNESVFLDLHQFRRLAHRLGIDQVLIETTVNDMTAVPTLKPAAPVGKNLFRMTLSEATQAPPPEIKEGLILDFFTVSVMLMDLEEQNNHRLHKRELQIKAKAQLSVEAFWGYQGELARLYDNFQSHDSDRCDYLGWEETKQLLHHLGLLPYRPREAEILGRLLRDCDSDGSQTFTFDEFLELIAAVRGHQRAVREARLRREFGRYIKLQQGGQASLKAAAASRKGETPARHQSVVEMALNQRVQVDVRPDNSTNLEVERLHGLLTAVGLSGNTNVERDVIDLTIRNSCEVSITFAGFEELCQRICENITRDEVEEQYADAESLGINNFKLHRCQAAFDNARIKDTPGLKLLDLPKVLGKLLIRPPPQQELDEILEVLSAKPDSLMKPGDTELPFRTFLRLMSIVFGGQGNMTKDRPFTLKDVAEKKLREILILFPLTSEYIEEAPAADLPEMVGNFLSVRPNTNLRELNNPISNIRQLITYAQKRSALRMDMKQPETFVSKMEAAVSGKTWRDRKGPDPKGPDPIPE